MTSSVRRAAELGRVLAAAAALAGAVAGAVAVFSVDAHEPDAGAAPLMDFVPPPAGSYPLHAIMRAPDGAVLDLDGRRQPLRRFTSGKITLLGFMYASCSDPHGCPLAYQVFHTVRHRVATRPELRDRVRLVSLSFDPARDTPRAMRSYMAGVAPALGARHHRVARRPPGSAERPRGRRLVAHAAARPQRAGRVHRGAHPGRGLLRHRRGRRHPHRAPAYAPRRRGVRAAHERAWHRRP